MHFERLATLIFASSLQNKNMQVSHCVFVNKYSCLIESCHIVLIQLGNYILPLYIEYGTHRQNKKNAVISK